jgi:hypothetical protein
MKCVLFGGGYFADKLLRKLRANGIEADCIVDNDCEKWGCEIAGTPVKSPNVLCERQSDDIFVLISVLNEEYYLQITAQLKAFGMVEERNFTNGITLFQLQNPVPGVVSGCIDLPNRYEAIKSYDRASRLIVDKEHKRIFRGVYADYISQYNTVAEICKNNDLLGSYIVNTKITDSPTDLPFALLLEHQFIEPISYCYEWSPKTFKDYVSFMIDFVRRLDEAGLSLTDGHALNATIYEGRFQFLDFGAISVGKTSSSTFVELINTHLIPLLLMHKNQATKAYLYLKNTGLQYTINDIIGYMNTDEVSEFESLLCEAISSGGSDRIQECCHDLSDYCKRMTPIPFGSRWDGYQNDEWNRSETPEIWSEKMRNVITMLQKIQPNTLIDIAGNKGWYGSFLCAQMKYSIIVDLDFNCIDLLWNKVRCENIRNVIPLCFNMVTPSPDYYRDEAIGVGGIVPWRDSAVKRLKCECVLALAITHHLAFSQQLTFYEILSQLAIFSKRYLIVEFIEKEDEYITDFLKDRFDWYTKRNFIEAIEKQFVILEQMPSTPSKTRSLFLCELKLK